MAQVIAPVHTSANPQNASPHGKKRAADSSLESEQRLSKRFDLLNIVDGAGTRLYIPVSSSSPQAPLPHPANYPPTPTTTTTTSTTAPQKPPRRRPRSPSPSMQIDDTPHKIYIHDLAAEFSDIESDSETPIFIPDIEAHISRIPKHVLTAAPAGQKEELRATRENQLVLWNGVGQRDEDRVRRAIMERRGIEAGRETARKYEIEDVREQDGDAMDLD